MAGIHQGKDIPRYKKGITTFYFQGIFCEATLKIDQLEFPASGASPRNASEWISEVDVNRSYYKFVEKEKVSATLMYNTL